MKISDLSNTVLRFVSAAGMLVALIGIIALEVNFPDWHAARWAGVLIMVGAIAEMFKCINAADSETFNKNSFYFISFLLWLFLMLVAVYFVGARPRIMLWLLLIIVGADVGGWFFGLIFGGDKLWERLSAKKTWAGQIGGIICGTGMSLLYFLQYRPFDTNCLFAVLFGCSIALMSQYGDLTASFIKRCLGIKDFGNMLPGHGGILDRFDGWIYVLPFMWFFI